MKYYTIKECIQKNLVDLCDKQIRRRLITLDEEEKNLVKKVNSKYGTTWKISEAGLFLFKRKRKSVSEKKICNIYFDERYMKKLTFSSYNNSQNIYKSQVTINLHDDLDQEFYEYLVKVIFICSKQSLFFNIEIDENNFHHLHIGSCATTSKLEYIIRILFTKCLCREFLEGCGESKKSRVFDISSLQNRYAYKKYIEKGNDGLGGLKVKYLNLGDFGSTRKKIGMEKYPI